MTERPNQLLPLQVQALPVPARCATAAGLRALRAGICGSHGGQPGVSVTPVYGARIDEFDTTCDALRRSGWRLELLTELSGPRRTETARSALRLTFKGARAEETPGPSPDRVAARWARSRALLHPSRASALDVRLVRDATGIGQVEITRWRRQPMDPRRAPLFHDSISTWMGVRGSWMPWLMPELAEHAPDDPLHPLPGPRLEQLWRFNLSPTVTDLPPDTRIMLRSTSDWAGSEARSALMVHGPRRPWPLAVIATRIRRRLALTPPRLGAPRAA